MRTSGLAVKFALAIHHVTRRANHRSPKEPMTRSACMLWPIKPCLVMAISVLEATSFQRGTTRPPQPTIYPALPRAPLKTVLADLRRAGAPEQAALTGLECHLVRRLAVEGCHGTLWYSKTRNVVASTALLLSSASRIPWQQAANHGLNDEHFAILMKVIGRIGGAPITLARSRKPDSLILPILHISVRKAISALVLDSIPSRMERFVLGMLSQKLGVRAYCISRQPESHSHRPRR